MAIDLWKTLTVAGTAAGVIIVMQDKKTPANKRLQYAGIVIGAGGAAYLGRHIYTEWKRKQDLKQIMCEGVNLSQIAAEIYAAFYKNDWFGASEDEEMAIAALKKAPKSCIDSLAMVYNKMYDHNLRQDFTNYLDSYEYGQVSHLLN